MQTPSHLLGAALRLFTHLFGRTITAVWTFLYARYLLRKIAKRSGKTNGERRWRRDRTARLCHEFLDSRIDLDAFIPSYAQAIAAVLIATRVLPNDGEGHYNARSFRAHHPNLPDRGVLVRTALAQAEAAYLRQALPRASMRPLFRAAITTRNIKLPQLSAHTVLVQARAAKTKA